MIAAPARSVSLPVLPTDVGSRVLVNSTAETPADAVDGTGAKVAVSTAVEAAKADAMPEQQKWRDAAELARQQVDQTRQGNGPLGVRLSYLPNMHVTPKEPPQRPRRDIVAELPPMMPAPDDKKKVAANEAKQTPAECKAFETYKKKQLEEIKSDQRTLQQLQSAIADLGLQKQLNFMNGQRSADISVPVKQPQTATP